MATTSGFFASQRDAERAVYELERRGYSSSNISVVRRNEGEGDGAVGLSGKAAARYAIVTSIVGAVIGGFIGYLSGASWGVIPGIGPVWDTGPLAVTLSSVITGAVIGAAAGSVIGVFFGLGVTEDELRVRGEGATGNAVVVTVQSPDEKVAELRQVFKQAGAIEPQGIEAEDTVKSEYDPASIIGHFPPHDK